VGVVWHQETVADSLKDCTQSANTRQWKRNIPEHKKGVSCDCRSAS